MGVSTSIHRGGVVYVEHTWVHSQPYAALPPYAVVGGHDCDGSPIYVGRAYHEGDQLPAKVIPSKGCAYVAYGGMEHSKSNYEVLVGQGFAWVPCAAGSVPPNAVRSGFTRDREPLYVGRGHHANSLCVGKIHPSHGCLYIPFGGQEVRLNTYEVLVYQQFDNWVSASPNYTPPGAVVAGHDSDRTVIYVGRAMHNGEMLPAKFIPSKSCAYVCFGGYEHNKTQFEVLCGYGYSWVQTHHHVIPQNAVSTGRSRNGEPLFIGRGHHHGSITPGVVSVSQRCLYIPYGGREIRLDSYEILCHTYRWVHSSAYSSIPPGAIIGGNDTDGDIIYVGRAFHNGDTLVAKVIPSKHIAFVSWRGEVIPKEHFEILCGEDLVWEHCYDHVVPDNAILCGETSLGQPIYIGRGHYNGSLTVGKISSVHRALFIASGGNERRLESYEILVEQKKPLPGWAIPTQLEEKKPLPPPLIAIEEDFKPMPTSPPLPLPPPPLTTTYPPTYAEGLIRPANFAQTGQARPFDAPPPYTAMPMPQYDIKPNYVPPYGTMPEQKFSYTVGPLPEKKFSYAESYMPPPPSSSFTPAETYIPTTVQTVTPAETYLPPAAPVYPTDVWVPVNGGYTPPRAVHAGNEANFAPIYVCRAFHYGSMVPGKYVPSHNCAYIGFSGMEITKYDFEVLVGEGYRWIPTSGGHVPPGAVEAGRIAGGEPLFVGRAHYMGSLIAGRVQRSHYCLYIPYGGKEIRIDSYEILVRTHSHF